MNDEIYRRAAQLMEADVGNELVALDVDAGSCFGFNEVATSVWRMLSTPMRQREIEAALLAEYDVSAEQCRAEVAQLLTDMLAKRLITAA